ncbi:spore germination protein [Paenibacillus albus]|uniref:Spore germination protein n=1 Tax=Paenibacillus albus TaxID=2495582 RepID=A0A3S9A1Y9_9BACL|nr:spore germination protein [Paenibacillus albus]AZN39807.1 spore germination protein [Paenibacillus albus]
MNNSDGNSGSSSQSTANNRSRVITKASSPILDQTQNVKLTASLETTIQEIQSIMKDDSDFIQRRFQVFGEYNAAIFYYSSMIDQAMINSSIMKPLMHVPGMPGEKRIEQNELHDVLMNQIIYHSEVKAESNLSAIVEGLLRGHTAVIIDGLDQAFLISTSNIDKRAVDQPATEQVIRGPREGFIELLDKNISLIRYRLQTPELRIQTMEVGRRSRSRVAICYMDGITNAELVNEVKHRISKIDIDAVLDSGYLEQFIEDNHYTPFPQVQYTERPDKVVANLLEGRVAILVNGSPLALIVPTVFSQFYQTAEDYTERFVMMSAIRLARLVALVFSLVFPSLYVSIISFNPELIPTEFAVAVAGGRAGVPFPAVIEVLIIEISMEVLREATIRLPRQIGGALSIVGVLVIGQAAVSAGFASPITVVIIALTTIGSFATPAYNAALSLRLLRFPLIIFAGIFGLYGVVIGLILIANHLLSLKSFGVPYLTPWVPGDIQGMKDLLVRGPLWRMGNRPSFLYPEDSQRVSPDTVTGMNEPPYNVLDPEEITKEKGSE